MGFNVYVTRRLPEPGLEIVRKNVERMDMNPEDRILTREELLRAVKGRDGILCLLTDKIDAEVYEAAKGAKIFANYAVGFDNVDVKEATKRGLLITNTPGVLTDTTADMAWALMFATARRLVEADAYMRNGRYKGWGPMLLLGGDVYGKTLGLVGVGRIGSAVAKRTTGFAMRVLYTEAEGVRNEEIERAVGAKKVDLPTLLRESDFVSVHTPLLKDPPPKGTWHLLSDKEFAQMKPTAYVINTARGPIIDEEALVRALKARKIAGAGLDVYEDEPRMKPGLAGCENAVLIPHTASGSIETRTKMATMAAENLIAGLNGRRPPNLVNPEVLEKAAR